MLKRLLITTVVVGAMAVGFSSTAFAHATLTGTDPDDGSELAEAPADVTLEFSEELDGPSTEIAVTDPDGNEVDVDDPEFDGNAFTQPMLYNEPGEYTLAYRILSQDGHRVEDTLTFSVEEVPAELSLIEEGDPADEPDDAEETEEVDDVETTEAADEAADENDDGGGAPVGAFIIGILAVIIVGVLLVKLVNRSKAPYTDDSDENAESDNPDRAN